MQTYQWTFALHADHSRYAKEYQKVPPAVRGDSVSHPITPPLQPVSLDVNVLQERQKLAALFAVLQAGPWHVIAL
ncbi:TPA: hypothetical protein ACH3X1_015738 [Trebouxia sp. C0004]